MFGSFIANAVLRPIAIVHPQFLKALEFGKVCSAVSSDFVFPQIKPQEVGELRDKPDALIANAMVDCFINNSYQGQALQATGGC